MEGFKIREATLKDKQAVLDINDNVYDGIDYLKALYVDEFTNSYNTTSYVGEFNGKIVGFAAATLVDDGRTVVSRAGRVNQHYANKGFYKILKTHASSNSGAVIDAFTTVDTNPALDTRSFQQQNSLILRRTFHRFDLKPNDTRLQTSSVSYPNNIFPLTQALLGEYLKTEEYRKCLFPEERIVVNWVPFCILPSNIPLFWKRNDHCHRVTDLRIEDGNVMGLMSILTTVMGVSGILVCSLDVFGKDVKSLQLHLMSHFEFLSKRSDTESDVALLVTTDLCLESGGHFERICGELGLTKLLWNHFEGPSKITELLLFERILSHNE